ncbi:MAG: MBL fold metallo-hydrolase [Bacteroidia bacterium]|nr:MAG: MBL fold metallo-hydrolase [Bacteroidia bacterium]
MAGEIYSFRLGLNSCYLIRGTDIVMVDGGNPNKLGKFKRVLSKLNISPDKIKLIILTHSHFDHSGSAREISEFTGAKIAIHESERSFVETGGIIIPKGVNTWGKITKAPFFAIFRRVNFPRFTPDILITSELYRLDEYGIKGSIIHTPGHTFGSLSVVLNTGEAFVGCMAHNGLPFRFRPGLPIYALDIKTLIMSWRKLIEMDLTMVFPGHGKPFSVDIIRRAIRKYSAWA